MLMELPGLVAIVFIIEIGTIIHLSYVWEIINMGNNMVIMMM